MATNLVFTRVFRTKPPVVAARVVTGALQTTLVLALLGLREQTV